MRIPSLHIQVPFPEVLPERLTLLLRLSRGRLSALVALSGLTGYLLAGRSWNLRVAQVALAILLLSAGCSALNQWQEREINAI